MRIQNSIKNIFFGLSGQIISSILGFLFRSIFIFTLGAELLGMNELFSSILIMLSLANLGFDTAMIYSLYRPLAENDTYRIQALMNLYKNAYRIIGIVVLLIGLSLFPFLPFLINGKTTINNINIIYILFLLNSVFSYFFVYKQSIIVADQRNHIISKIHTVFIVISNLLQIVLLLIFKSYILVLLTQIVFRVLENIYISYKVNHLYPYIANENRSKLSKVEKNEFFKNLYAFMLYKISGVVITGTDNIVISKFIGIYWVGVYSNYFLIFSTLNSFLSYIFYSIKASIGNVNATENQEKQYFIFRVLNFSNFWVYGFCSICLWNLFNPFIDLWLGKDYLLNGVVVLGIILNFYTSGMQNASTTFRETTGLFKKGKYRPIYAAIINIVFSIILTIKFGMVGVFLGTIISRLFTYFWFDPFILYKYVFNVSIKKYFMRYGFFTLIVLVCGFITYEIGNLFQFKGILNLLVRGFVCLIIPNIIFYLFFKGTEELKYLKTIIFLYVKNVYPNIKNFRRAHHDI